MKIINGSEYTFSRDNKPVATAKVGEPLLFKTQDCFGCQIESESQLMDEINLDHTNPTAGPVYIEGAEVGDVLVVDILNIDVDKAGFACSIPGVGPLHHLAEPRTRKIPIEGGYACFNDVQWPINPMVGVIGTAPAEGSMGCGFAHNHGGNMDSNKICKGARVYLPVRVPGGLLQMGDIHATMGDGEVCGTGIEVSGEIMVKTHLIKNFELNWPVTETDGWWYVNSRGKDYDDSLVIGCSEMARLMQPAYDWDVTDIFIYLSLQGSMEINQGTRPVHGDMVNLRIGVPKLPGKELIK